MRICEAVIAIKIRKINNMLKLNAAIRHSVSDDSIFLFLFMSGSVTDDYK